MIIHKPKIKKKGNFYYLSSDIEVEKNNSLSTNIWYKFPLDQKNFISERSDCFVVGMIFLAMKLNENITVEGKMSPKLAYNLKQFQGYFHSWYPEEFNIIKINCKNLIEDKGEKKAIVNTFSGGVDSFYTLVSHIKDLEKKDKLTHSLFIGGFDVPLDDRSSLYVKDYYEKILKKAGIKLLRADTNLKEYIDGLVKHERTIGAVLTSVFLALSNDISRVYLASTYLYQEIIPLQKDLSIGTNPVTDGLFSLEKTSMIHHDSSVSRIEKTIEISKWPMTYDNLRVCWHPEGLKNCSRCSKCVRTIIALHLIGRLDLYSKSFDAKVNRKIMKTWIFDDKTDLGFIKEILDYAKSVGKTNFAFNLKYFILRFHILNIFYRKSYKLKNISPLYKSFIDSIKKINSR